jgi:hypothetical protein
MKVTTARETEEFRPVTVSIILETQAELDALGSLFNTIPILNVLEDISDSEWDEVYETLRTSGADIGFTKRFVDRARKE